MSPFTLQKAFSSAIFCLSSVFSHTNAWYVHNPQLPSGPASQNLWDPKAGPLDLDINQHELGDCWLDAVLASVAYADPEHLKQLINDPHYPNATVSVTLFDDDKPFRYTVTKNLPTGKSQNEHSDADGFTWPSVMEDAFRAFAKDHPDSWIPVDLTGGSPEDAYIALYGSGFTLTMLKIENGKVNIMNLETEKFDIVGSEDDLWNVFQKANSVPATAGTKTDFGGLPDIGIESGHAYSIKGGDKNKSINGKKGIVTLRNPWGSVTQNPDKLKDITDKGDGVFDMLMSDFEKYFEYVDAAQPGKKRRLYYQ